MRTDSERKFVCLRRPNPARKPRGARLERNNFERNNMNRINNLYVHKNTVAHAVSTAYTPDGGCVENDSEIIHEHIIRLYINDDLYAKTTCTADDLAELVVGKLICERMIKGYGDISRIDINEDGSRAQVYLDKSIVLDSGIMVEPTCCTSNKVYLKPAVTDYLRFDEEVIKKSHKVELGTVFKIINAFSLGSNIHKSTKGTHSAYLAYKGEIVFDCEDIGRHNAMDKVIGYSAIHGMDPSDCIIFTSGRVPVDMVQKVIFARVPILISKAVVTDEALKLAKECGLTLICKAWPDKYEVFA